MLGESYRRRLGSLLLYLCYGFWALINSPLCWFCTSALGLYFRFVAVPWISEDRPLRESLFQSKVWRKKQHNVIQMMTSFERCGVWPLLSHVNTRKTTTHADVFSLDCISFFMVYVVVYLSAMEADQSWEHGDGSRDFGHVSCLRSSPCALGRLVHVLVQNSTATFQARALDLFTTNTKRKMNVWLIPNQR